MITYAGVADCHGIESFQRKDQMTVNDRYMRIMRAAANGQRHAIYYEADIEEEGVLMVEQLLKDQQYEMALRVLKRVAVQFSLLPEHEQLLNNIPNPDIDPYN